MASRNKNIEMETGDGLRIQNGSRTLINIQIHTLPLGNTHNTQSVNNVHTAQIQMILQQRFEI